ncbi:sigma-70 family RNA polymerase sigma factor [Methylobacterium sp. Leaf466]|uniref:sigma-70 family RNA polymerase sigma factor n=1 Tax=Methylobacterium sp. Leaf466 TaxID=1736386 RepID=UPI0009E7A123
MIEDSSSTMPAPLQAVVLASLRALNSQVELPSNIREHLGSEMRTFYNYVFAERPPTQLLDLIAQLESVLSSRDNFSAETFRNDLLAEISGLRAFAMSLANSSALADDLVQETMVKAWANQHRFQVGTNFKAWLYTILRNHFYTECRKRRREFEDVEGEKANQMTALADQEYCVDLQIVWNYIDKLPPRQREALVLVAAQGMTYEDAANLVGCQVGTMKSRVSRARDLLARSLGMDEERRSV